MKKSHAGGPESDMNICDKLTERHLAVVQQGLSTILKLIQVHTTKLTT